MRARHKLGSVVSESKLRAIIIVLQSIFYHLPESSCLQTLANAGNLQNLAQLLLLGRGETRWEVDLVSDDKVSTLPRLLGNGHTESWESLLATRLCRAALVQVDLLAIDCGHSSLPASEGLLEVQSDGVDNVVVFALVERMFFL